MRRQKIPPTQYILPILLLLRSNRCFHLICSDILVVQVWQT